MRRTKCHERMRERCVWGQGRHRDVRRLLPEEASLKKQAPKDVQVPAEGEAREGRQAERRAEPREGKWGERGSKGRKAACQMLPLRVPETRAS